MTVSIFLALILYALILGPVIKKHKAESDLENLKLENKDLKLDIVNLEYELDLLHEEYDRVYEENQVFTSIMGAIELEPHGHGILENLWGEYSNEEE